MRAVGLADDVAGAAELDRHDLARLPLVDAERADDDVDDLVLRATRSGECLYVRPFGGVS